MATVTRRVKPKVAVSGTRLRRQSNRRIRILVQLSALTAAIAGLWILWNLTASTVEIEVDGVTRTVQTHRRNVGDLLTDVGLMEGPEAVTNGASAERALVPARVAQAQNASSDTPPSKGVALSGAAPQEGLRVSHDLNTRIIDGLRLSIERPQRFLIVADGREYGASSWATTPAELMADAGIPYSPRDQVLVYGIDVGWDDEIPTGPGRVSDTRLSGGPSWEQSERAALAIEIKRSARLTVYEDTIPFTIHTLADTVGEALRDAQGHYLPRR